MLSNSKRRPQISNGANNTRRVSRNSESKVKVNSSRRPQITKKIEPVKEEEFMEEDLVLEDEITENDLDLELEENIDETEEVIEEVDDIEEEEEEIEEEEIFKQPVKTVRKIKSVKTVTKKEPVKKESAKKETKKVTNKRTLGRPAPKKEKKETKIDKIFPKKYFIENIQKAMDERWEGITKADVEYIVKIVENEFIKASSTATFRFAGGVSKKRTSKSRLSSPPIIDEKILMLDRDQIILTVDLNNPEKYKGYLDETETVFTVKEVYNYETKEWENCEREFHYNQKDKIWE